MKSNKTPISRGLVFQTIFKLRKKNIPYGDGNPLNLSRIRITVMGKLYIRSICLRVQGKDHLTHLLLVLVERPLHRLRRIAEILTVTNHQLMKNGILHGARVALSNAPLINCRYTLDVLSSDS